MTIPATNRSIFDQSKEQILERGLHTMSLACDALTNQVDVLSKENKALTEEISVLRDELTDKTLIS